VDRLSAIVDYLTSLEIAGATESKKLNHSAEFFACINTLVDEDLLKKQTKKISAGTSGDELVNIYFKCNYDIGFVTEIAEKINFHLKDFLFGAENNA
jgi:hypothetical protein